MAEREEPEWMKEFYKKVVKDKGLSPGNDQYVTLECGHDAVTDVPHSMTSVYRVGELVYCLKCEEAS